MPSLLLQDNRGAGRVSAMRSGMKQLHNDTNATRKTGQLGFSNGESKLSIHLLSLSM